MKKLPISLMALCLVSTASAQNLYEEGFESPSFDPVSGDSWLNNGGTITRETNGGSSGYTAKTGTGFAIISGDGPFTRMGGYQSGGIGAGFSVTQDFYVDLTDPLANSGNFGDYGFDLSNGLTNTSGDYMKDFIFHVSGDGNGAAWVGASNNTDYAPASAGSLSNHVEIQNSGWYTAEWQFSNQNGFTVVNYNVRDANGGKIWSAVNYPGYTSAGVGGHRFTWSIFEDTTNGLVIDNTRTNGYATPTLSGNQVISGTNTYGNDINVATTNQSATSLTVENTNGNGALTTYSINQGVEVTAPININMGGILAGSGSIIGNVTVSSGGVHAPGFSLGVQTITGNYENSSILEVEIGGVNSATGTFAAPDAGNYDQIIVDGDVDFTGTILLLPYNNFSIAASNVFAMILATGEITYTGNLDVSLLTNPPASLEVIIGTADFDGTTYNALMVIPEPSEYAILASLAAFGFVIYRRRKA